MKVSPTVTTISLIAFAGLSLKVLVGSEVSTPAEILSDVRERFATGSADGRLLVRELTRGLEDPRTAGQEDLLVAIYLLRSEVNQTLGDLPGALEDVEIVLDLYRPQDPAIELRAAILEAADGRVVDALARARGLTRRGSPGSRVFSTIGGLEHELALAEFEAAEAVLSQVMVGREASGTLAALVELCSRHPIDPDRQRLADELKAGVPAGRSELIKTLLDRSDMASWHNRAARLALADALIGGSDADSARMLIDLLREAGRADIAVDLAQAASGCPTLRDDPGVFESTLDALVSLGHQMRAAQLVEGWGWRTNKPSAELCQKVLRLMLDENRLRQMAPVIAALRESKEANASRAVTFYQALQASDRAMRQESAHHWTAALRRWDDFLSSKGDREPIPGGQALSHLRRAAARRALGDVAGEREDLLRAITPPLSAAEDVWFRYVTAEDYMRISELSEVVKNTGYRGPENRWTHAMSLAPESWEDLYPHWVELGKASLQNSSGFTFTEVYDSALNSGGSFPVLDVGPQTLYEVGREHLRRGQTQSALIIARQLLSEYPGLIPAYNLMIEAQLSRGSRVQVTVDMLDRLALTGPDNLMMQYLTALGEDVLTPPQQLEWMRLDPRHLGRRIVATRGLADGRAEQALRSLGPAPEDPTAEAPGLRLLRSEALVALDRPDEALLVIGSMEKRQAWGDDALRLQLSAACAAPEPTQLTEIVPRMVARLALEDPPREAALQAVEVLLSSRRSQPAGELLDALDASPETRGGRVLEAMTLHALLIGDREGALEALERSEAFFDDGRVELRRLILAIDDRNWRRLPTMAVETRAALGDGIVPWLDVALLLLEERLDTASELAFAALEANPRSPQWNLLAAAAAELTDQRQPMPPALGPAVRSATHAVLRGREDSGLDPREIIGLVIATEHAGWAPSVSAACESLRERGAGELWPRWLAAQSLEVQGLTEEALVSFHELATEYPSFGPSWDGWEHCLVQLDGAGWGPERIRLCAGRAEADASHQAGPALEAIDQACRQFLGGDRDAAILTLESLLPEDRRQAQVSSTRLLAHLYQLGGDLRQAADALELGLPRSRHSSDSPVVADLVATLVAAAAPDVSEDLGLASAEVELRLAQLIEQFPQDPLPVLAWCRMHAEVERRNPAVVVDVISGAFESLRTRTSGSTLASLRPGAARDWGRFLIQIAPVVGERFLLEDLASTPGNLDLWRLLALTVDEQGRTEDAGDLHAAVVAMSSDPRAHLGYAWFLLEHGHSLADVTTQLDAAKEVAIDDPIDPDLLRFVSVLSQLRDENLRNLNDLVEELEDLWERRAELDEVPTLLLGRTYMNVLLRRLQPQNRRPLETLLEELEKASALDPYVADLARAARALAPSILRTNTNKERQGNRLRDEDASGDEEPDPERRGGGRKRDRRGDDQDAADGGAPEQPEQRRAEDRKRRADKARETRDARRRDRGETKEQAGDAEVQDDGGAQIGEDDGEG
jgi:tetratricopeptide (TPR) repeat protein